VHGSPNLGFCEIETIGPQHRMWLAALCRSTPMRAPHQWAQIEPVATVSAKQLKSRNLEETMHRRVKNCLVIVHNLLSRMNQVLMTCDAALTVAGLVERARHCTRAREREHATSCAGPRGLRRAHARTRRTGPRDEAKGLLQFSGFPTASEQHPHPRRTQYAPRPKLAPRPPNRRRSHVQKHQEECHCDKEIGHTMEGGPFEEALKE
jgi:hypothetical protein